MTPAGIEPATFRFVAQHLNHCATAFVQCDVGKFSFSRAAAMKFLTGLLVQTLMMDYKRYMKDKFL